MAKYTITNQYTNHWLLFIKPSIPVEVRYQVGSLANSTTRPGPCDTHAPQELKTTAIWQMIIPVTA